MIPTRGVFPAKVDSFAILAFTEESGYFTVFFSPPRPVRVVSNIGGAARRGRETR